MNLFTSMTIEALTIKLVNRLPIKITIIFHYYFHHLISIMNNQNSVSSELNNIIVTSLN